jgi:translation initiation factor 2 beta subunit (eIF-2beta)/eIF-5
MAGNDDQHRYIVLDYVKCRRCGRNNTKYIDSKKKVLDLQVDRVTLRASYI